MCNHSTKICKTPEALDSASSVYQIKISFSIIKKEPMRVDKRVLKKVYCNVAPRSENNSDQKIQVDLTAKQSEHTTLYAKIFHHTIRYVERKRKDGDGTNLSTGNLKTKKTGVSGSWEKQSRNSWLDTIGIELNYSQLSDNAGAYYDYRKFSAKLSHEIKGEKWKSVSELGWANYLYDTRSVSPSVKFERQSYAIDFLVTRKISSDWETYFKWRYEEDQSNDRDYEYYTNFWALGVKWEN